MSEHDLALRGRITAANEHICKVQQKIEQDVVLRRVRLKVAAKGTHSRRKYKPGTEFLVYHVLLEGTDRCGLWLSRIEDKLSPQYELSVWLHEVEFVE